MLRGKATTYIDLNYHVTKYYEIKRYIQDETVKEEVTLIWDKVVQEAKHHEHTCLEVKGHKQ